MKSLAETLREAEPDVGIPATAESFALWGKNVQPHAESVWPAIADQVLKEHASRLFCEVDTVSPIEQKLYFALQAHFIDQLMNYPDTTCLQVRANS